MLGHSIVAGANCNPTLHQVTHSRVWPEAAEVSCELWQISAAQKYGAPVGSRTALRQLECRASASNERHCSGRALHFGATDIRNGVCQVDPYLQALIFGHGFSAGEQHEAQPRLTCNPSARENMCPGDVKMTLWCGWLIVLRLILTRCRCSTSIQSWNEL